jgi:hypothetical protein
MPGVTPEEAVSGLAETINNMDAELKSYMRMKAWKIKTRSSQGGTKWRLTANTWTLREWLDVLEVRAEPNGENGSDGTILTIDFFSTGIFPTVFCCAPLLNLICFWHPVGSHDFQVGNSLVAPVLQPKRVATLRELLEKRLSVGIEESGGADIAYLGYNRQLQQPAATDP